jgi:hypothetical protein
MNGGSAFPYSALSPEGPAVYKDCEGMTLRDYFAAKALVGLDVADEERAAKWCYQIADAMLKARES